MIDNLFAYVALLDTEGVIQEINKALLKRAGYSREDVIGQNFFDAPLWSYDDQVRAQLMDSIKAAREGQTLRHDVTVKMGHELVPVDFQISPVLDQQGGVVGLLATGVDISARNQTGSISERYKVMIETTRDGFWVTDLKGNLLEANQAYSDMSGYSADELLNMHVTDLEALEDSQEVNRRIERLLELGYNRFESKHRHKDGRLFDVEVCINFIPQSGQFFAFFRDITERQRILKETESQLRRNRTLMKNAFDGIHIIDIQGNIVEVNDSFCTMLGYTQQEASRLNIADWNSQYSKEELLQRLKNFAGKSTMFETVHRRKDGTLIDVQVSTTGVEIEGQTYFFASSRDITDHKFAEQSQKRLTRALNLLSKCNMVLGLAEKEKDLLAEICKLAVETGGYRMAWVGFAENDAAKTVRTVAQSGSEEGYLDTANITWADTERGQGPTGTAIRTGATVVSQDVLTNPKMALWREAAIKRGYQSSVSLPLVVDKLVLGALTIYSPEPRSFNQQEVTLLEELAKNLAYGIETLRTRVEHGAAQKKLEFLAHHDPLTKLPNRLLLRDRFDQAAALANREHTDVALFFLDLDNFKQINDSLGHGFGDHLLVRVAGRLQGCIRETDTISRQGGDEFVILMTSVRDLETIEAVAQNIIDSFVEPFDIDGYILNTSFSIGISVFPSDGEEFDTLLKHADTALYQAKEAGRNTYRFFSRQMNIDALEHMQLQGQLRNAMKNQEFLLHYQPQIDTVSERIIGAEALLRWEHPELGLIPPNKFIPLAERSGLIIQIGEWVLNEACRQARAWQKTHQLPAMMIAVNLSALQFKRGNIVQTVVNALERSGLPASQLELELTESILLHDVDVVMKTIRSLKEIGVKLSIDDFGTGYSSLSYLKRLAVDKLKIDQSFVRDMVEDPEDAAIVKSIIQLGHTLQLTATAEGVENDAQLALLRNYGCDDIQGYLFSRPLPAADFVGLCKR